MAIVIRNGNRYYYSKKRVNGRPVSIYSGANQIADELAAADKKRADESAAEKQKLLAEIAEYDQLIALVDELERGIRLLTKATLLTSGYHTHKGQWRKTRTKKPPKSPKPKPPTAPSSP